VDYFIPIRITPQLIEKKKKRGRCKGVAIGGRLCCSVKERWQRRSNEWGGDVERGKMELVLRNEITN
jgi:hypothetical protein